MPRTSRKESGTGDMTVREAGKKGGEKGGPRVRELINEGKEHEAEGSESNW